MEIRIRKSAVHHSNNSAKHAQTTLSSLREDTGLWRICVLLNDLRKYWDDPSAVRRLLSTTHKLYIGAPYFSESDAVKILTTRIQNTVEVATTEGPWTSGSQKSLLSSSDSQKSPLSSSDMTTVEEAINKEKTHFFDKRRARGNSRPSDAYRMVPINMSVLGINKEELQDKHFLRRLWRLDLET